MIRQLRSGWRRDSGRSELEELDILSRLDLLVIDEIGVQFSSDAERVQLFDVINRRYADLRPTILVTNLTLAEIQETLGERVFDRFREVATVVTFDWPSFRGKRAA
jgi:DNA replication protein DnaC